MSSSTTLVLVAVLVGGSMVAGLLGVLLLNRGLGRRQPNGNGAPPPAGVQDGGNNTPVTPVNSKASRCPDAQAALQAHNAARARRGASPLTWDDDIAKVAQAWSDRGVFKHSTSRYGENLAMGTSNCKQAVDLWVDEERLWRPGMGFTMDTGHFTQVVWKNTRRVGCGFAKGIVTCNYDPPGNGGNYGANV